MNEDVLIELKDASIYQQEKPILKNVSFTISKGEFVYVIGRVGSGKTSLIKTLQAELPLQKGTATIAGFELSTISEDKIPFLRRKLGIVFQDFQLLTDRNIYENLRIVLRATGWRNKKLIKKRILEVLTEVKLEDKLLKMPNELSGGEQQRVVVARALLNEPEIILADEPTGNLDPDTSEEIMKIFRLIKESGRTVIMATHNYSLLKKHDGRILKLDDFRVADYPSIDQVPINITS